MENSVALFEARPSVEDVYRADADRLWRSVVAFCGDREIASDAVAEAYAQLLRRGEGVRDPVAWTWRAAFRIASGALKESRRTSTDATADRTHMDRYADPDLVAALSQLGPGQRAAVVLFYLADLPVSEIAKRLATNSLVVRANLSRGRRRLREILEERNG